MHIKYRDSGGRRKTARGALSAQANGRDPIAARAKLRHVLLVMDDKQISLSPPAEGAVGAVIGAVLGAILVAMGIISTPAIAGVAAGVGIGSWFNAWRRARRNTPDGGSK